MNGESKWSAELDDDALEGVSGGRRDPSQQMSALAGRVCRGCSAPITGRCDGGSEAKLSQYMTEHGPIGDFKDCPYFNR